MRFLVPLIALLGAIIPATTAPTSGFHALTRPGRNEKVPAGKKYKVRWKVAEEYEDEKVVISLLGGDTGSTLDPIGTIGRANGGAGSFTWRVDPSLGAEKTYGLVISLASDGRIYQYSMPFRIDGRGSNAKPSASATAPAKSSKTTSKDKTTEEASSSSTKSKKTTTTTSSSASAESTPVVLTSFSTAFVTDPGAGGSQTSAAASATASSEPAAESDGGGSSLPGNLTPGALAGIAAGGVAGLAVLLGMASMVLKMTRRRKDVEKYRDLDGQY